jgi:hypothetical protein
MAMRTSFKPVLVLLSTLPLTAVFSINAVAQGVERPLVLGVRQSIAFDSNTLQTSPTVANPTQYGTSKKSDQVSATSVRLGYQNTFGTQAIDLTGEIGIVRYANLTLLNRTTDSFSLRWNSDWAPWLYTQFDGGTSKTAANFANQLGLDPNSSRVQSGGATFGFRFTPVWSTFARLDEVKRDNSSASLVVGNLRTSGRELGLRYQPQSGIEGSVLFRKADTVFPNPQTQSLSGVNLGSAFDNSFSQRQLLGRVSYQPTGISSFTGELGVSSSDYKQLSQRNGSGLVAKIQYAYAFSDAWSLSARVGRDQSATTTVFASNVVDNSLSLGMAWKPTARVGFRSSLDYSKRNFQSDPGSTLGLSAIRQDTVQSYSLGTSYELLRNLNLSVDYRHLIRGSTFPGLNASGNVLSIGLDFAIR